MTQFIGNINYLQNLNEAAQYYTALGFEYIDVPWIVPINYIRATYDGPMENYSTGDGSLVGSGEQSFLSGIDELREDTLYMTMTPCFRDEPVIDEFTRRHFYKLELFSRNPKDVRRFIGMASSLFTRLLYSYDNTKDVLVNVVQEDNPKEWDITVDGCEVGSYGTRKFKGQKYAYGTGLAEPRFSTIVKTIQETEKHRDRYRGIANDHLKKYRTVRERW